MTRRGILLVLLVTGLHTSDVYAADAAQVQAAVEKGVLHLRQLQGGDGTWASHPTGATALVGLALLECDVATTDPAIQAAARHLRSVWTSIDDHGTYCLALTVLFLDRLGDPADVPIIQALAIRLLAGQNAEGGWDYHCPQLSQPEVRTLQNLIKKPADLKTTSSAKLPPGRRPGARPPLPKEMQQIVTRMKQTGAASGPAKNPGGDNSNTQFAVLALWVARRHGVPVEQALSRTAARFRGGQNADGGWGYVLSAGRRPPTTASMTCAGLLGLAIGYGSARETTLHAEADTRSAKAAAARAGLPPAKDPAIRAGLGALTRIVGQPLDISGPVSGSGGLGDLYYLLWSVERVGVAYDLSSIGTTDWYEWGTRLLLNTQGADGGWHGRFASPVDTSFALLFLRRANLSRDLTPYLKSAEPIRPELKANVPEAPVAGEKPAPAPEPKVARPATVEAPKTPAEPAPAKEAGADAARLGEALATATGRQQEDLLNQLKQAKGAAYTDALAASIGRLSGEGKAKARDALAERLARMTAETLRDKIQDREPEIRRAAALACAMKEDKRFVPDLVGLLSDQQKTVVRAAHAALKALTSQDFGPGADLSPEACRKAAAAWDGWWKKQPAK